VIDVPWVVGCSTFLRFLHVLLEEAKFHVLKSKSGSQSCSAVTGGTIEKTALLIPLLLAAHSWAAPNPDEYPVNVHVSSSRWFMEPSILGGPIPRQKLDVIIDGKKYELEASTFKANLEAGVTLLALGDYQAKLIQDQHKTA
jgi:hypothetical protein